MRRFIAVLVAFAACFVGMAGVSYADIFGSSERDIFKVDRGDVKALLNAEEPKPGLAIDNSTILEAVGKIIDGLGARAGYGYDFVQHEGVALTGSTIYTTNNFCLDLNMINALVS